MSEQQQKSEIWKFGDGTIIGDGSVIGGPPQQPTKRMEAAWHSMMDASAAGGRLMEATAAAIGAKQAIARHTDTPNEEQQKILDELEGAAAKALVAFDKANDAMITAIHAERAARA